MSACVSGCISVALRRCLCLSALAVHFDSANLCSSIRFGGILTIYVAISFSTSQLIIPVMMFTAVACVAAFLAMRLPFETKQQKLADVDHDLKAKDKAKDADDDHHGDL